MTNQVASEAGYGSAVVTLELQPAKPVAIRGPYSFRHDKAAGRSRARRQDHIRRNTKLRLFAGISVLTGAEKSNGSRYRNDRLEVSQTPGRVAIEGPGRTLDCSGLVSPLRLYGP